MSKSLVFYLAVLLLFGAGICVLMSFGSRMADGHTISLGSPQKVEAHRPEAAPGVGKGTQSPVNLLLLQMIVIVAVSRTLGVVFGKIGQPAVIGEMIAGILLGPSLLGLIAPGAHQFLFPATSLAFLGVLSQVGIILFMFATGLDLDLQCLYRQAHAVVLVSHASILVPFFLGTAASVFLYAAWAPAGIPFNAFSLFLAVAMSITAFPVLVRILEDIGISRSPLGRTAIACAAVDDMTAWCLLAVVIALVRADGLGGALSTILLALLFIGCMLFVVRPWLGRFKTSNNPVVQHCNEKLLTVTLLGVFGAASVTELIGIHTLFGAFLAGICMPAEPVVRQLLREHIKTFSSILLPLFFAVTGLRTEIGLLDEISDWLVCAGLISVAIAGKLGGSMAAARWTGMSWIDSFSLGALMNTRGLVELIVLNLGLDLGILSPRIFTMLVLMALVTTFMTGPLLQLSTLLQRLLRSGTTERKPELDSAMAERIGP